KYKTVGVVLEKLNPNWRINREVSANDICHRRNESLVYGKTNKFRNFQLPITDIHFFDIVA
ncbi:hypothetical protein, partial [Prevotella illustrans]|uniref:hypothetical protein n=1 Tax=Prevotella illustrans TaxID=2800387 RepID=UPI001A9FAAD4